MTDVFNSSKFVKDALAGDQSAWNALYRHFYPHIYSIALRICGNTPAAEDAVQDTFTIAWLKLSQLKEPAAMGAWLKSIVTHYCYRLRRGHSFQNLDSIESVGRTHGWENELMDKYDRLWKQSRISGAIATLPEMLRTTLLLRYFSEAQSYGQIARVLEIPVGTVRSRLHQAKQQLKEYWQQNSDHDQSTLTSSEEWNAFYFASFSGLHHDDYFKNKFVSHLDSRLQVVFTSGRRTVGSEVIEVMVHEDREVGSWFSPFNVQTSGNISIVEAKYHNSPANPGHCPEGTVCILSRDGKKVTDLQIVNTPK